ncbi:hypothetical protein [Haloarchaeobius sp. HRN-SO-5]
MTDVTGRCLATGCDATFEDWRDAAEHRRNADHPDHGEIWEP